MTSTLEDQGMMGKRRSGAPFVSLLLVLASMMLGSLPKSYAQSAGPVGQNHYFIQGAIRKPGVYEIESAPSLLKLITLAGGLADNHGSTAFIIRKLPSRAAGQPAFNLIQVSINALLKGKFDEVAYLEPGDIVNIPSADVYFVARDLKSAIAFPFTEGVTVLQAIARGVTSGAKSGKAIIFRQDPNTGKRQEITVDLDAVTGGKQKDILLQPNDIVILPTAQNRIGPWPPLLDAPPIRVSAPCRDSRPCMAQLDLSPFEAGNEQDGFWKHDGNA
jgi:protein involved in polysaccharide export with SLBB domain